MKGLRYCVPQRSRRSRWSSSSSSSDLLPREEEQSESGSERSSSSCTFTTTPRPSTTTPSTATATEATPTTATSTTAMSSSSSSKQQQQPQRQEDSDLDGDKLHPKPSYDVRLIPATPGRGREVREEQQEEEEEKVQKKEPSLKYARALSAVDDSDDDDGNNNNTNAGVNGGNRNLGQDTAVAATAAAAAAATTTPNNKNSKKKKNKNSKKKNNKKAAAVVATAAAATADSTAPEAVPVTPSSVASPSPSPSKPRTKSSSSYNNNNNNGKKAINGNGGSMSLTDEHGDMDSTSSTSSSVDHSTQTTSSAKGTTIRIVRWMMILVGLLLLGFACFCVIRDPTLPNRTVEFILQDMPHATTYKTQLQSTQQELLHVRNVEQQLRIDIDLMTQKHADHVRESQIDEAKYKTQIDTLTKQYHALQEEHQEQRDELEALRQELTAYHYYESATEQNHTTSTADAASDTADASIVTMEEEKAEAELHHRQFLEELEQSRREQEQELVRQIHQKSSEMEQRLMDDFEHLRAKRTEELDEELRVLKETKMMEAEAEAEAAKAAEAARAAATARSNSKTTTATAELTIGQQVDAAVQLLKTKSQKVQERVVVASSSMIDVPVQLSESVFLKAGPIKPGEPIVPQNVGRKLKTATVRFVEDTKDVANSTINTLESSSRSMIQATHELLVKAEEGLVKNDVVVEEIQLMASVDIPSEQSYLLKGAWKAGDPLVPKVIDRMFKSAVFKSKQGMGLLQNAIESIPFPTMEQTKEATKLGLDRVSKTANSTSALLKTGIVRSKEATKNGLDKMSKTANSTSILIKTGIVRSKEATKVGLDRVSETVNSTSVLLKTGFVRSKEATKSGLDKISKTANTTSVLLKTGFEQSKEKLAKATNTSIGLLQMQSRVVGKNVNKKLRESRKSILVATNSSIVSLKKNSRVVGSKVTHTLQDARVHSMKNLEIAKSVSERLLKEGVHQSVIVSKKTGHKIKQITTLSVEKLSQARVYARDFAKNTAGRSRRLSVHVGNVMRTGLEVGKKKIVQGVAATNRLLRDVKTASVVVGKRIGSDINDWKVRGNKVWEEARESTMTTFALAFP